MKIRTFSGSAVLATSIEELNSREMRQMFEMRKRIETVLKSHKDGKKKQYLSDDELKLIHAILYVFTKHMGDSLESEFDKAIEQLDAVEQPTSHQDPKPEAKSDRDVLEEFTKITGVEP